MQTEAPSEGGMKKKRKSNRAPKSQRKKKKGRPHGDKLGHQQDRLVWMEKTRAVDNEQKMEDIRTKKEERRTKWKETESPERIHNYAGVER